MMKTERCNIFFFFYGKLLLRPRGDIIIRKNVHLPGPVICSLYLGLCIQYSLNFKSKFCYIFHVSLFFNKTRLGKPR